MTRKRNRDAKTYDGDSIDGTSAADALPNARLEDVTNDKVDASSTMTRRTTLRAIGGLAVGSTIIGAAAAGDTSVREHPELPNYKRNWDPDLEMGLSGAVLYTRDDAEAHTVEVARLMHDGTWTLDTVDLIQYGDDGEPESDVRAEDLAEGATVVFLRAHNDRGSLCSPDYEEHDELNALLDD